MKTSTNLKQVAGNIDNMSLISTCLIMTYILNILELTMKAMFQIFLMVKMEKQQKKNITMILSVKRETHKENGTTLIETYSYEKAEGVLTDNFMEKLKKVGVVFSTMSRDEVWSLIENQSDYEITGFVIILSVLS